MHTGSANDIYYRTYYVYCFNTHSVGVVTFSANDYSVSEGNNFVQIGVELLTTTERPIVVTLIIQPGTAQSKENDYVRGNKINLLYLERTPV